MSKIVKPMGPVVKQIKLSVDAHGTAMIEAKNLLTNGPLDPIEYLELITQFAANAATMLRQGMAEARKRQQGNVEAYFDGSKETKTN